MGESKRRRRIVRVVGELKRRCWKGGGELGRRRWMYGMGEYGRRRWMY